MPYKCTVEHKVVHFGHSYPTEAELNEYGDDNWELVSLSLPSNENHFIGVFCKHLVTTLSAKS